MSTLRNFFIDLFDSLNLLNRKPKDRLIEEFEKAAKPYCEHLENRYGIIKILDMEAPIDLGKHYTTVNISRKIPNRLKRNVDLLEEQLKNQGHFGHIAKDNYSAIELITKTNPQTKTYNNIVLLGKLGVGKTTFLRYIALEALKGESGQLKQIVAPIIVELRELSQSNETLTDFIEKQFDTYGINNKSLMKALLSEGKCLILLDGLDEVGKGKVNQIVNQAKALVNKYHKNRFVISCRIADFNHVFEQFVDVEIADFNQEQIEKFVLFWFDENKTKSGPFLEKLKENKSIKELATTPLLLALMCIDYGERMEFSPSTKLYKHCIDTLLGKWDVQRNIERDEIYKNLSKVEKELMFSNIAERMFREEKNFLSEQILAEWISDFIKNLPSIKLGEIGIDSRQIIKAIEAQHGIFVERAEGIYSFSHLTFQEYFAAKFIADNKDRASFQLVETHLLNSRACYEL